MLEEMNWDVILKIAILLSTHLPQVTKFVVKQKSRGYSFHQSWDRKRLLPLSPSVGQNLIFVSFSFDLDI